MAWGILEQMALKWTRKIPANRLTGILEFILLEETDL
jgi:hypothetical protein